MCTVYYKNIVIPMAGIITERGHIHLTKHGFLGNTIYTFVEEKVLAPVDGPSPCTP